jgi:hypothetical protein
MSTDWVPPRSNHLRVFVISLAIMALSLLAMLFGVHLDAVVPATGIITARHLLTVRSRLSGLVEPGWYEGQIAGADGKLVMVRLDADGNGITDPAAAPPRIIREEQLRTGEQRLAIQQRQFCRLQPGDILWPGQPLATVRDEGLRLQLLRLDDQIREAGQRGEAAEMLKRERDRLREWQAQGAICTPDTAECWLVLEAPVAPLQQVKTGDVLVTIVPADPATRQPKDLIARLEVDERHWAAVQVGAKVRLSSAMYNPRMHGYVEVAVDRLEPWGEPAPGEGRRFHALAPIPHPPFALPLGSSFQADISVGRKPVYRIILEH